MVSKFLIIIIVIGIATGAGVLVTHSSSSPQSSTAQQSGNHPAARPFVAHGFAQTNCRCVAFRLDDVQDYWESSAQQQVMAAFASQNMPLTIGVIGNHLKDDAKHIEFIKQYINSSNVEVANHGWNHEDFSKLKNYTSQAKLMNESNEAIHAVLGVTPTVFIAPYDEMDNNTILAAQAAGLQYISAFVGKTPFPYATPQNGTGIIEVPGTVVAGSLNETTMKWSAFTGPEIMHQVDTSVSKYGFAIVVLHPQVFFNTATNQVDTVQLGQLKRLIELVQYNYPAVTLSKIANQS